MIYTLTTPKSQSAQQYRNVCEVRDGEEYPICYMATVEDAERIVRGLEMLDKAEPRLFDVRTGAEA